MNDQDSFYVNITSDANGDLYPGNKTSDFRVQLPETLNLDTAHWQVGLATLQYPCDINNIGNSVGTALYIWDGFKEHELEFPNWHCKSIENLTAFLNDATALCLNPKGIQSGEKTLQYNNAVSEQKAPSKRQENIRTQNRTPSAAFLERQRLNNRNDVVYRERIDIINKHADELDRMAVLVAMSQVKDRSDIQPDKEEEEEEEEEEIGVSSADNIFDVVTTTQRRNRVKRLMRPIERYNRNYSPTAVYSSTIADKKAWHKRYFDKYAYTQEPDYYPVTFKVDKLDRTTIECESPIFDIGISDSLGVILGLYEQRNFSIDRYRRRRKFMDMLKSNLRSLEGIQSQYVNPLARDFQQFNHRIKHMIDIATALNLDFKRLWQHVRLAVISDTGRDSAEITSDVVKEVLDKPLSRDWPRDDPVWCKHLDNDDFYMFVKNVQRNNKMLRTDSFDTSLFGSDYTQDGLCGLILSMYMLKTIYTETLLGQPLYAQMPGQINPHEFMQVYMDVVRPEPFNGFMTSLLALVKTEGQPGETARYEATRIQYKSLAVKNISCLKVLILSPNGQPIPFQRGPVLIQLHFTRNQRSVQLY